MDRHDKPERLMSLDALRGADMLFIMGFSGVVVEICAFLGFGKDCWLAAQMSHVPWHGLHHHDTIFPLFLFLAGVSWPFSFSRQKEKGYTAARMLRKIFRRALVLSLVGLMWSGLFSFNVARYRWDSVLAHIGWCWAAAAVLHMFVRSWKTRLAVVAFLLVAHWLVLGLFTAPDASALMYSADAAISGKVASYADYGTDGFSFIGNLAGWIDRRFMPGRLHEGIFDPDGLFAKLTGTAMAMLGVFAGEVLIRKDISGKRSVLVLFLFAVLSLVLCLAWMPWCPVNKKLWTSTFVLGVGAYSFMMLAVFHWLIDVKGWRKWSFAFRVIGMNAIAIYVLRRVVSLRNISEFFLSGVASWGGEHWHALVIAVGEVAVGWLILLFLYRKKVFFKV